MTDKEKITLLEGENARLLDENKTIKKMMLDREESYTKLMVLLNDTRNKYDVLISELVNLKGEYKNVLKELDKMKEDVCGI